MHEVMGAAVRLSAAIAWDRPPWNRPEAMSGHVDLILMPIETPVAGSFACTTQEPEILTACGRMCSQRLA